MIDLVLTRHGQPDWEPGGFAVDAPGLTELGHAQAERLATELAGTHFDALYVSPLRRAEETARPIASALGMEPVTEPWLAELGMPELAGASSAEVARYFEEVRGRPVERWWDGMPGGEGFRDFHARVTVGIEKLLLGSHGAAMDASHGPSLWQVPEADQKLLIVAHGGTNSLILGHLLGLESVPWAHWKLPMGFAGVSRLTTERVAHGAIWSLGAYNARGHLAGLPDPAG